MNENKTLIYIYQDNRIFYYNLDNLAKGIITIKNDSYYLRYCTFVDRDEKATMIVLDMKNKVKFVFHRKLIENTDSLIIK